MMSKIHFESIDQYHDSFPEEVKTKLQQLREMIREAAPPAKEVISYNIPTFKLNKNLVHYAAFKNHIGFYPTAAPLVVFNDELAKYKTSKGAVQFALNEPLPKMLIQKIVKYRIKADGAAK